MLNRKVLVVFSMITGIFFIISGIGKIVNTAAFSYLIFLYGFGSLRFLSPFIVLAEIYLGLNLFLLIHPRRNSLYSFVLLVIFTCAFVYAHFRHGVNDCGCMGAILPTKMPPLVSFLRNLLLIVMTVIVWLGYPTDKRNTVKWKKYVVMASMCIALFFAGNTYTLPSFAQKNSSQPQFKDKLVQNTALKSFIKTTADKSYLVFCFSYSCPHCWNSIENLRLFIRMHLADSVIVFGMGDSKDREYFHQNFKHEFRINDISHDSMIKLTTFYPTAFYIRHDSVKAVLPGVLLSPITFRKYYLEADFKLY